MYDWLDDALHDSSQVITASRRLARVLGAEYSERQLEAGRTAWRSPVILSWQDWLSELLASSADQATLPIKINAQQSKVLWERCLRREVSDPLLNTAMLARQLGDAWSRVREWQVSIADCQLHARNRDQRLFAVLANSYQSILDREGWIDDPGVADLVIGRLQKGDVTAPPQLTLAGFDRLSPLQQSVLEVVRESGSSVQQITEGMSSVELTSQYSENSDAELRAAGAWARNTLMRTPDARVAIVVTNLEQDAIRSLRLIKEGLLPGWQNASQRQNAAVNVSYGRKLVDYPAIATGLLALQWLQHDLATREVSHLLRTPLFDANSRGARTRIELRLRQLPDRAWSPENLLAEIAAWGHDPYGLEVLGPIQIINDQRQDMPARQSPAEWATLFDEVLVALHWPGTESLDSAEFQLLNKWRELLNDIARLDLVSPAITLSEALGRIATIAGEVVFQPEAQDAVVDVMGPLEAAGLQFDDLWISGLSENNWPPQSKPLSLVSRDLQRTAGMPDSSPADTLEYAERVISRLTSSASRTVLSFPQTDDDAQQSMSDLLRGVQSRELNSSADPGWHAHHLINGPTLELVADPVPPVTSDEIIAGGAATIQRQFVEPFTAFAVGRLGVRYLAPIVSGLSASVRGNLIHNAMHRLYEACPASDEIRGWDAAAVDRRCDNAVHASFRGIERYADAVLLHLLGFEKLRVKKLLQGVISRDIERDEFRIKSVEKSLAATIGGIDIRLRIDRVDLDQDEQLIILDYKTGAAKRLLDRGGEPKDMQLVVYACALQESVSGMGLFNIDTRSIELDAAGRDFTPKLDWDSSIAAWKQQVILATEEIAAGDVRINRLQSLQDARAFGILGRHRELLGNG